jgi:hypothetical protein
MIRMMICSLEHHVQDNELQQRDQDDKKSTLKGLSSEISVVKSGINR